MTNQEPAGCEKKGFSWDISAIKFNTNMHIIITQNDDMNIWSILYKKIKRKISHFSKFYKGNYK